MQRARGETLIGDSGSGARAACADVVKDTITGMMLVFAMILFFATSAALVVLVGFHMADRGPTVRSQAYTAKLGHSHCLTHSYWWWRSAEWS
jgi:hypothetical protein